MAVSYLCTEHCAESATQHILLSGNQGQSRHTPPKASYKVVVRANQGCTVTPEITMPSQTLPQQQLLRTLSPCSVQLMLQPNGWEAVSLGLSNDQQNNLPRLWPASETVSQAAHVNHRMTLISAQYVLRLGMDPWTYGPTMTTPKGSPFVVSGAGRTVSIPSRFPNTMSVRYRSPTCSHGHD